MWYYCLICVFLVSGCAAQLKYTFTDNVVPVTSCVYSTISGAPITQSSMVSGTPYICKTSAIPTLAGGVSTTNDGQCQQYCPKMTAPIEIFGVFVYTTGMGTPTTLKNPFTNTMPTNCMVVTHKCDDVVDAAVPINRLSISLYGSDELKRCVLNKISCENTLDCAVCSLLDGIQNSVYPPEWAVLKVRGTAYSCLLTYLAIGSAKSDSKCWDQLGDHCTAFPGKVPYCISNKKKTAGITNQGSDDRPASMWCYYTNWAQYRDAPYKVSPSTPPANLAKCDGVIYAFATIKVVGAADMPLASWPGYAAGDHVCSEFEWNDSVQMPAVTSMVDKVLLSIGGWNLGVEPWRKAAATSATRATFVKSCITLMKKYNFDGIDIDWEAPNHRGGTPDDIPLYGFLAAEFRAALNLEATTKMFTTAVMVGYPINANFEMEKNHVHFDKIFLMTYDLHGGWDPSKRLCHTAWDIGTKCGMNGVSCSDPVDYFYLDYAIGYYAERVPVYKLSMGLAFYGRGWQQNPDGSWATLDSKFSPQLKEVGVMGYSELTQLYKFACKYNSTQLCCMEDKVINGTRIMMGWDEWTTMADKMDRAYTKYGIKNFFSWTWDYDVLPLATGHDTIINYVKKIAPPETTLVKTQMAPQPISYQIGNGTLLRCPGIQAVVNDIAFSGIAYSEFFKLRGFSGIVVADVKTLTSCTPGGSIVTVANSSILPGSVDINTFLPSSDPNKFLVMIAPNGRIVQYTPTVQRPCQEINTDNKTVLNYVELDSQFYFTKPEIRDGYLLLPQGLHYFKGAYNFTVDYINFETKCMNYKIDNIPSCIAVTCGGNPDCIAKYSSICDGAAAIILDAKRSNQLILDSFGELENERLLASMYSFSQGTGLITPGTTVNGQFVDFIALGIAIASGVVASTALYIATQTSADIDKLIARQDLTAEALVTFGEDVVTISNKLDQNIHAVNQRITDFQDQVNNRFDTVNKNFATQAASISLLSAQSDERFLVTIGYISWYQQMIGLIDQLTQGAIQMNHKVTMTKLCARSLEEGTMANCPSDAGSFKDHPGLRLTKTVKALRYYNKKLIIVNHVPTELYPFSPAVAFPLPIMKLGQVCWPAYTLSWTNGSVYMPLSCKGRYCDNPVMSEEWETCKKNFSACNLVCSDCYRGACYNKQTGEIKYTNEDSVTAVFKVQALPVFNPLLDNLNVTSLIQSLVFSQVTNLTAINTTANLQSIQGDIAALQDHLAQYQQEYNSITVGGMGLSTILTIIGVILGIVTAIVVIAFVAKMVKYCQSSDYPRSKIPYERVEPQGW